MEKLYCKVKCDIENYFNSISIHSITNQITLFNVLSINTPICVMSILVQFQLINMDI